MGGMLVSARDLARYVAFHLSAWPPRDDADTGPVRRSSVREMQHPWRPSGFRADRAVAYGYGLGVTQTCRFNRFVSHSGGLPGFGSNMAWLPDSGVGIFVMANLTYSAAGAVVEQAFEALRKGGGLKPRELPPSPDLVAAHDAIVRAWNGRDSQELERLAADNLFQDFPATDRMRRITDIQNRVGACRAEKPIEVENFLRGGFRLTCQDGDVDVYFTLAPTMPPKVQRLDFAVVPHLPPAAQKSVQTLADAVGRNDAEAAHVPAAALYGIRLEFVSCRVGETLSTNGTTRASIRLDCEKGPLLADIEFQTDGGLKTVAFRKPEDQRCTP
jgi:hypothetical protein